MFLCPARQIKESNVQHKNKVKQLNIRLRYDVSTNCDCWAHHSVCVFAADSVPGRHPAGRGACHHRQGAAGVQGRPLLPGASGKTSPHPSKGDSSPAVRRKNNKLVDSKCVWGNGFIWAVAWTAFASLRVLIFINKDHLNKNSLLLDWISGPGSD